MIQPPITFTQGDTAVLSLTAVDASGNPIDLTGATFTSFINGANGVVNSFPNSQHTANPDQVNYTGQYSLSLAIADTDNCGLGLHKEILTLIMIGETQVYFRGFNTLRVYAPVPFE